MKIFILVLGSFFLSPLIKTGLPIKQFTWLNEIIALLVFCYYFLNGKLFKDKVHIIEILLIGLALSLTISNLFGYVFLNVYPALIDFYQVFNLFLFIIYFRIGRNSSRFDIENNLTKLNIIFLLYAIFNLVTMFSWGFENLMPYYITEDSYLKNKWWYDGFGFMPRSIGRLGNANSSALISNIILIFYISWSVYKPKYINKYIFFFSFLMILFGNLSHFSRTGLLSLAAGLFFLFWDKNIIKNYARLLKYIFPLIFSAVFIAFFFLNRMNIDPGDLRGFNFIESFASGSKRSTLSWRFISWEEGIYEYFKSPIFGLGIRNNPSTYLAYHINKVTPHNEFIDILMTTGLFGFVIYILFYISIINISIRINNKPQDRMDYFLSKSLLSIVACFLVHNIAVGSFFNSSLIGILSLITGYIFSRHELLINKKNIPK